MKTELLKILVRDSARIIPIVSGGVVWLAVRLAGSAGLPLDVSEQNTLGMVAGVLFAAWLEAWQKSQLVAGTKGVQTSLKERAPDLDVDGIPGPITNAVTKDVVASATESKP